PVIVRNTGGTRTVTLIGSRSSRRGAVRRDRIGRNARGRRRRAAPTRRPRVPGVHRLAAPARFGDHVAVLVPMIRTFDAVEFAPATLVDATGDQRIAVCVPARDEASTIGPIIETIRRELIERVPLVDELLVLDDHSSDGTARVARAAGAEVVPADTVLARY